MDCSIPGFPVRHHLLELAQTRPLRWWCLPTISSSLFSFASCPQSFPASGFFPMSQFFTSGGQSMGDSGSASVIPKNIQDGFPLGWLVWSPWSPRDSQRSSPTPQIKSINSSILNLLYGTTLKSIHDYWKNHYLTIWIIVGKVMPLLLIHCLGLS